VRDYLVTVLITSGAPRSTNCQFNMQWPSTSIACELAAPHAAEASIHRCPHYGHRHCLNWQALPLLVKILAKAMDTSLAADKMEVATLTRDEASGRVRGCMSLRSWQNVLVSVKGLEGFLDRYVNVLLIVGARTGSHEALQDESARQKCR
jgi:hypothetical protein